MIDSLGYSCTANNDEVLTPIEVQYRDKGCSGTNKKSSRKTLQLSEH